MDEEIQPDVSGKRMERQISVIGWAENSSERNLRCSVDRESEGTSVNQVENDNQAGGINTACKLRC